MLFLLVLVDEPLNSGKCNGWEQGGVPMLFHACSVINFINNWWFEKNCLPLHLETYNVK